ncbi:MAG: efflux RND transporter periplasmic adaptor subunit [Alphaproteobacteria bacterium]|nr:efflux RND transporter periplasmic adaptor subunit [Alphaproteobacteria bacterium]
MKTLYKLRSGLVTAIALLALVGCSEEGTSPSAKKEAASIPGVAAITPEAAKAAGIQTAVAGPAEIRETITLYGSVKSNGEKEQGIRAKYPGTIRAINKSIGDAVSRGDTLLTVESSASLQDYRISSPIKGTVLDRKANVGETVNSDTVLMRVADLSTAWVEFAVFARDLGHIRSGMPVKVMATDGHFIAEVRLDYVAPSGDADNQSVVARATVDNARNEWVPGQFVTGDVIISESKAAIAVLPSALQSMNGKPAVFVQDWRGFAVREVTVGRRSQTAVEIVSGLRAGERKETVNSHLVKADLLKGEAEEE